MAGLDDLTSLWGASGGIGPNGVPVASDPGTPTIGGINVTQPGQILARLNTTRNPSSLSATPAAAPALNQPSMSAAVAPPMSLPPPAALTPPSIGQSLMAGAGALPNVVGQNKLGAFVTGLSSGINAAGKQDTERQKLAEEARKDKFQELTALWQIKNSSDAGVRADAELKLAQDQAAHSDTRGDAELDLQRQVANKPPAGFTKADDGTLTATPGGPSDPAYLQQKTSAEKVPAAAPAGFAKQADGSLAFIPGGPNDPAYLEKKSTAEQKDDQYTQRAKIAVDVLHLDPKSPEYGQFIADGKSPFGKPQMSPTEEKLFDTANKRVDFLQGSLNDFNHALSLNDKIYSGKVGDLQVGANNLLGGNLPGIDQDRAANTDDFNTTIKRGGMASAKDYFPGRVTNFDEQLVQKLLPNSGKSPAARATLLQRAIDERQKSLDTAVAVRDGMKSGDYFRKGSKSPNLYDPAPFSLDDEKTAPAPDAAPAHAPGPAPQGYETNIGTAAPAQRPAPAPSQAPPAAPQGMPAGAQQARDGNWYVKTAAGYSRVNPPAQASGAGN